MLLNVQMLRGIAAFLVVFVHLEAVGRMAGFAPGWSFSGNAGVDLFFVISGMIMVVTTAERKRSAAGFLRNRVARVVPLYWAITFMVLLIALAAPQVLQATSADPVQFLKSLAFIPFEKANGQMHPTVFVGWTLNYEMMFYLLFAAGLLLPGRRTGLAAVIAVIVAMVAAGVAFRPEDPVLRFYAQPLLLEFAAGMVLGWALPHLPVSRAWRWPAILIGLAAFACMLAAGWLWPQAERTLIFGAPATVVVACAVIAERAGLAARAGWIQLLGAASYAVYLTHFFCTQLVVKAAEWLDAGPVLALAAFPLALLLVTVVGVAAHRRLELPLTGLARRALAPQTARLSMSRVLPRKAAASSRAGDEIGPGPSRARSSAARTST